VQTPEFAGPAVQSALEEQDTKPSVTVTQVAVAVLQVNPEPHCELSLTLHLDPDE